MAVRGRTFAIMAIVTLAVLGAGIWSVYQRASRTEAVVQEQVLFPPLMAKVNEVTEISLAGAKNAFTLVRDAEGRWLMREKGGYPVKGDKVRKLVIGLAEAKAVEPRTDNPDFYDRLGVGDPKKEGSEAVQVTLKDQGGAILADLLVGKVKTAETPARPAETYVRKPGEARAWLAHTRIEAQADPLQWLEREMVKIERDKVKRATVTQPGGETVLVARDSAEQKDFTLAGIPAGKQVASQYDVNSVAGALDYIAFDDVRKADGMDFKDAVTSEIETFDGLKVVTRTARIDGKAWIVLEPSYAGDSEELKTRARELGARVAGWAYQVSDGKAQDLTRKMADLVKDEEKKEDQKG